MQRVDLPFSSIYLLLGNTVQSIFTFLRIHHTIVWFCRYHLTNHKPFIYSAENTLVPQLSTHMEDRSDAFTRTTPHGAEVHHHQLVSDFLQDGLEGILREENTRL